MRKTTSSMMKHVYKVQSEARNATLRSGVGHLVDSAWSYYAQAWMSESATSYADSLCYTAEDCGSDWAYFEEALWQVTKNIENVGVSVVTDSDFVELLEELGYHTVPCIDFDEDGLEITWWEVFSTKNDVNNFFANCDRSVINDGEMTKRRRANYEEEARNQEFGCLGVVLDFIGDLMYGSDSAEKLIEDYFGNVEDSAEERFCHSVAWREMHISYTTPKEIVGEVTKIGGVTLDEDDEPTPPEAICDDDGVKPLREDEDDFELSILEDTLKKAIATMAECRFEMVSRPTIGNLPIAGYFMDRDDDENVEVTNALFEVAEFDKAKDEILFRSTSGYEVYASEFLGWKSMRG